MTNLNTQQLNDQDLEQATGGMIVPRRIIDTISEILFVTGNVNRPINPSFESYYQRYKAR